MRLGVDQQQVRFDVQLLIARPDTGKLVVAVWRRAQRNLVRQVNHNGFQPVGQLAEFGIALRLAVIPFELGGVFNRQH